MTVTAPTAPATPAVSRSIAPALALARRSVIGLIRQPQVIFPSVFFPLLFTALNTASFNRAIALPGFPKVDSFLDFAVATAVLQGVLFGATNGGTEMATDIQGGFFDRLVSSPVPRWTIVVGRLMGAAVLGAAQAAVFLAVLTAFGAEVKGGPLGVLTILLVATLFALAIGGFSVALALRTGSAEAVQGFFPVFFISLFVSSAFFPKETMTGWFRTAATVNPLSWMVEAMRTQVISGFDAGEAARGLAVCGTVAVVSVFVAGRALQRRVAGP